MKFLQIFFTSLLLLVGVTQAQAKSTVISKATITNCGVVHFSLNGVSKTAQGKPGAGVCLTYNVPQKIKPGDTFLVKMSLTGPSDGSLRSEIKAGQNLQYVSRKQSLQKVGASMSKGEQQQLLFSAGKKGFYYIYVNAKTGFGNNSRTRIFAIPVNVGGVNPRDYLKTNGILRTTVTGEKIISMQAAQTIK